MFPIFNMEGFFMQALFFKNIPISNVSVDADSLHEAGFCHTSRWQETCTLTNSDRLT
jgi:hypothetical protein